MTDDPYAPFRTGDRFEVRVTPKASRNEVTIDSLSPPRLRVKVTIVPEGGKANAAVIKLIAKEIGVAKSRITLLKGSSGRDKLMLVE